MKTREKKSQLNRFKEAARELDCDEDERAFDDKLRRMLKAETDDENEKNSRVMVDNPCSRSISG